MIQIEVKDVHGLGVATLLAWDNGEMTLQGSGGGALGLTPETARNLRDALDKALALKGFVVPGDSISRNQERAARMSADGDPEGYGDPPAPQTSAPITQDADKAIRKTIEQETAVCRTLCSELIQWTWQGTLDLDEITLKAHGLIECGRNIETTAQPHKREWEAEQV